MVFRVTKTHGQAYLKDIFLRGDLQYQCCTPSFLGLGQPVPTSPGLSSFVPTGPSAPVPAAASSAPGASFIAALCLPSGGGERGFQVNPPACPPPARGCGGEGLSGLTLMPHTPCVPAVPPPSPPSTAPAPRAARLGRAKPPTRRSLLRPMDAPALPGGTISRVAALGPAGKRRGLVWGGIGQRGAGTAWGWLSPAALSLCFSLNLGAWCSRCPVYDHWNLIKH